jgi:hypothetical protein
MRSPRPELRHEHAGELPHEEDRQRPAGVGGYRRCHPMAGLPYEGILSGFPLTVIGRLFHARRAVSLNEVAPLLPNGRDDVALEINRHKAVCGRR